MLPDRVSNPGSHTYESGALPIALRGPAEDKNLSFYLYLSKKIRLDVSCESSATQRIHLKHQVLFSLKNNEKYL